MRGAQRSMQWRGGERLQNWATAWPMFRELERRFGMGGFNVDCCAEPWSAKCDRFITEEMDALKIETHRAFFEADPKLFGKLRGFWNPPFDNIDPFARMAHRLVELSIYEVNVMLVPARLGQGWFHDVARFANVYPILGRITFEPPPEHPADKDVSSHGEDFIAVQFCRPIHGPSFRYRPDPGAPLLEPEQ